MRVKESKVVEIVLHDDEIDRLMSVLDMVRRISVVGTEEHELVVELSNRIEEIVI